MFSNTMSYKAQPFLFFTHFLLGFFFWSYTKPFNPSGIYFGVCVQVRNKQFYSKRKASCFQIFSLKQTEKSECVVYRGLRCEPKAVHHKGTTCLEVLFYPQNTCCYSMIHLLHYKNYQHPPMIPLSKTEAPGRYSAFILQFFELIDGSQQGRYLCVPLYLPVNYLMHYMCTYAHTHIHYWSCFQLICPSAY